MITSKVVKCAVAVCYVRPKPKPCSRTFKVGTFKNKQKVKRRECGKERLNPMNIQMLPKSLYDQIFTESQSSGNEKIKKALKGLERFGLGTNSPELLKDVNFQIPKLRGSDINQHFENIAIEYCGPYVKSILKLCSTGLKNKPSQWSKEPG